MPVERHESGDAQNGGPTIETRLGIELVCCCQVFNPVDQSEVGRGNFSSAGILIGEVVEEKQRVGPSTGRSAPLVGIIPPTDPSE